MKEKKKAVGELQSNTNFFFMLFYKKKKKSIKNSV